MPGMMKKILWTLAFATVMVTPLEAQDRDPRSRWSIGTSLTYPMARIYQVYANYRIDNRHELFFGPCFQNFTNDSFTSNAYTLILGYRRYVWKDLSIEAELYPAFNRIYSKVTDSHYPGWELWGELKVGYTFNFANDRLYLHPAPGIGFGFFRTNKPPRFDEEITAPTFAPQVVFGIRL